MDSDDSTQNEHESDSVTDVLDEQALKQLKIEKEKKDLLASLASAEFSAQRTRVAYILNLYPESRNSDISLTLKYWETFQPDIYVIFRRRLHQLIECSGCCAASS